MAEQVWWAGLAAAVVLAAWWLWPRLKLKDRSSGEVYILNVLGVLTMLWVCIVGINFTDGWWSLPFWIVGIPAAIATGLLLGLAVIVVAVELDLRDDEQPDRRRAEHMNRTLRRVEGGDAEVVDALRFIGKRHGGKGDPLTSTCACLQGKPCLCPCHRSNLTRDQHGGTA